MDNPVRKLNPLLRLAAISGVETAVRLHIRRGDDLDARDNTGATPLILAAANCRKEAVQLLLDAGATPMLADLGGMDALAHATKSGCPEIIATLTRALAHFTTSEPSEEITEPVTTEIGDISDVELVELPLDDKEAMTKTGDSSLPPDEILDKSVANTLVFDDTPLNDFFVDSWEAEEEPPAPQGDATVAEAVRQVHQTISHHTVVDRDEDWGDVDISLPARAVPLVRDESNKIIRDFLLIALRDGIVLKDDLIDACLNTDGSRNEEAERLLSFVVGELGATVVEWTDSEEHFQTEPSMEEELLLAEAMEFAEELALGGNEPFRFYAKDIRGDLLEAEEEKALRQEMEEAGQTALSALATWPEGLSILFAAADRVAAGEADAESFSSGPEPPQNDETVTQLPSADTDTDDGDDEIELKKEASLFINAVEAVKTAQGNAQSMTEALERVQLTRGFLMDLANKAIQDQAGSDFAEAVHRQSAARERMILSNLRLALSIAKKYSWSNLALDDLIQEANIGLMKAVERYDWRKGFRFSTYATWWIRQQVARAIADKSRIVRVPVHAHDAAWKVCQERNQIETRLGRPETEAETAQRIGRSPTEIRKFISMFEEVISLDGTDPDTVLSRADGLADTEEIDPARIVNKESLHSALFGMFAILDERSQEVLRMRFGIGMDTDYTLEEVGQYFDVTRERIRQIQEKALKKLRHPSRLDKLRWFLE